MHDVFISYAREDADTARRLAECFGQRGWQVWWDPMLRAGERYDEVIESALGSARCVVVLWSAHSVASRYVQAEASFALERETLVPVTLAPVELPLLFRRLHTVDLAGWDGDAGAPSLRRLLDDLDAVLGRSPAPGADGGESQAPGGTGTPLPVPPGTHRRWLLGLALAAVAVALAAAWTLRPAPEPTDGGPGTGLPETHDKPDAGFGTGPVGSGPGTGLPYPHPC